MADLNFTPAIANLTLWRGNPESFTVAFTASGAPTDMTGVWSGRFCDGTGKITVDDTNEHTGVLIVTVAEAPDAGATMWELERDGHTYVAGEVHTRGC